MHGVEYNVQSGLYFSAPQLRLFYKFSLNRDTLHTVLHTVPTCSSWLHMAGQIPTLV